MAWSHFRATFGLAKRVVAHLLEVNRKHPRVRWQISGVLVVAALAINTFGMLGFTPPVAHATGEQWSWAAKGVLHVTGGNVAPANPSIEYQTILVTGPTTTGTLVMAPSTCTATVTVTPSADHKTVTIKATTVTPPCVQSYADQLNGSHPVSNVEVWGQQDIPIGCPGGPAGPTNGTYPCPGGGQVVNGTYYETNDTGVISGKVTLTANCSQATCGCPNATVNVTRKSGSYSGQVTTKTGGDGTYTLALGSGEVTLSTPDCRKDDGSVYSGASQSITVKALQRQGGLNYIADKLVASAGSSDDICDNANFTELNFWVCGFIKLLSDTARGLDDAVLGLLKIDTDTIFNDSGSSKAGNAYFVAWAAFRNIAYAILVLFALVMIASQILGMDFVDAYTLRKMLPRLVIGVILIAISWNGLDFVFNLSNDATDAIRAIIAAPFHGISVTIGNTTSNDISLAIIIPLLLTIGIPTGVAALALLGVGGIAALIGTIVLAVFSAWVLLVGRNIVADLLIIMSPIAIIFWAFGR
jgi:hypothetical protein